MSPCAFPGAGTAPFAPVAVAEATSRTDAESASACSASAGTAGRRVSRSKTDASRNVNAASLPSSLRGTVRRRSVHVFSAPALSTATPVSAAPPSSIVSSSVHCAASRA